MTTAVNEGLCATANERLNALAATALHGACRPTPQRHLLQHEFLGAICSTLSAVLGQLFAADAIRSLLELH